MVSRAGDGKRQGILWLTGGDSLKPVIRLDKVAQLMGIRTIIVAEDQSPTQPVTRDNLKYIPVQRDALIMRTLEEEDPDNLGYKWLVSLPSHNIAAYDQAQAVFTVRRTVHQAFMRAVFEAFEALAQAETIQVVLVYCLSAATGLGVLNGQLQSLTLGNLRDRLQLQRQAIWYHLLGIIPHDPTKDGGSTNLRQLAAGMAFVGKIYDENFPAFRPNYLHLVNQAQIYGNDFSIKDVAMARHFLETITCNVSQLTPEAWNQVRSLDS